MAKEMAGAITRLPRPGFGPQAASQPGLERRGQREIQEQKGRPSLVLVPSLQTLYLPIDCDF